MYSPMLLTTLVTIACAAATAAAQTREPIVHEILKTDTSFVLGVVEPASGRFIAYADNNGGINIVTRSTGKTTRIPGQVASQFGNSLSLSASGATLVFARPSEDKKQN